MLKRTALLAIAACLALLCVSSAQSQRRAQQVRVKQPEATVTQPKGTEDQRGTDQSPLIVKLAPTPKTDEERTEEAKEREQKAEADRKKEKSDSDLVAYTAKLADYTKELSFFTEGLFIATVILGIATIGLLFFAYKQSSDTRRII